MSDVDLLPLHLLVELAGVIVGVLVFWLAWHARAPSMPGGRRWLAACLLAAAGLDLGHLLSHAGTATVAPQGTDVRWLAARSLMAVGLLGAAFIDDARFTSQAARRRLLGGLAALTASAFALASWTSTGGAIPMVTFASWLPAALLVPAAWGLWRRAARERQAGHREFAIAALAAALGQLLLDVAGTTAAAVGQGFALLSAGLLYRGAFHTGVRLPATARDPLTHALAHTADPACLTDSEEREQLQRQLQQAQKLQALGQLAGGIAHDFNNMLAGILGLSQLALEHRMAAPGSKLEMYLQEIVKASIRARELVARLLAASRADPLPPARPLDAATVTRDIARMLARTLPAGIELAVRCDSGLPGVRLAEVELHQLLMNLVINARDALGGHGRIVIAVSAREGAADACAGCGAALHGRLVQLSVTDNGGGIAPQALVRLFEPFFTTKESGRGTGLGLAVVHGIAHTAGGHVTVASTPGQGSTFSVWLPASAQPDAGAEDEGTAA